LPDGFPSVYYRFLPEGFEEGNSYTLYLERIGGVKEVLGRYKAVKGSLVNEEGEDLRNHVQMVAYYCPAEPFVFVLERGNEEAVARIVPHPVSVQGKDGAEAALTLMKPDGTHFICMGEGFKPNERVRIRISSGKEVKEGVEIATDEGKVFFEVVPVVKKKKRGKCTIEFQRQDETLVLKFSWGKAALEKVTAAIQDIPTDAVRNAALDKILSPAFFSDGALPEGEGHHSNPHHR
jgi:antitoxin (DNA-binding transcriptional repressor) of toxin-antitoxin stability system